MNTTTEDIDITPRLLTKPRINFSNRLKVYRNEEAHDGLCQFNIYTTNNHYRAWGTYRGRELYSLDDAPTERDFLIIANALDCPRVPVLFKRSETYRRLNAERSFDEETK